MNNQLCDINFFRSQRSSYLYRETPWCPSIYIIDLNKLLLLFLFTITKQNYFSSSYKLLFDYIVFEFTLLLVVRTRLSENYIATISCTWEWASSILIKIGGDPWLPFLDHRLIESPIITALAESLVSFLINPVSRCWDEVYLAYFSPQEAQLFRSIPLSNNAMESDYNSL